METEWEEQDRRKYIINAMRHIDQYIFHEDYRRAFGHFLITIQRLNGRERQDFIDYYNLKLIN